MGALDGRVAVVTGGGRGLGRAHALFLAAEGARVTVNDVDYDQAAGVVAEIAAAGGRAVACVDDVTTWGGGRDLVERTLDAFGDLHVLVNNAGHLRDRYIVNMTEDEWDSVIAVHLKGHFVPLRHAAAYWRERHHAGDRVAASVINTTSTSGLFGNPGQANYGAAKAGVAALTVIAADELGRYGVRVNAVVPEARTRLTEGTPGLSEIMRAPADDGRFDPWDPANASPLVGWLASTNCVYSGRILGISGGTIEELTGWSRSDGVTKDARWSIEELAEALPPLLDRSAD